MPRLPSSLLLLASSCLLWLESKADFIARPTTDTTEWRFATPTVAGTINKAFGPGSMTEIGMTGHKGVFTVSSGAGTSSVPGAVGGVGVPMMYFDGAAKTSEGYRFIPNTGVTDHYEFTLVYDLFVPSTNSSAWLSLFQGNPTNSNNADWFLKPSTLGTQSGSTADTPVNTWAKGAWQRIAIVCDHTRDSNLFYVNGVLRASVDKGDWAYGTNYGWILSDNGNTSYVGEHSPGYIASFAFVPRILAPSEVATLGSTSSGGIYEVSDGFPDNLAAAADTNTSKVTLTWFPAGALSNGTGVEVLRNGGVIASLPLTTATYQDTLPAATTANVPYVYSVRVTGGGANPRPDPSLTVNWSLPSLSTGLLAYYPFEGSYANLAGSSVPDAVPGGAPRFIADGRRGRALRFLDTATPAQKATVSLGTSSPWVSSDFSVSLWYRHQGSFPNRSSYGGSPSDPALISNKNWTASGASTGWVIAAQADGSIKWNYKGASGSRLDQSLSSKDNGDGRWHHLLVTHARAGVASFYIDGAKLATTPSLAGLGSLDSGLPLVIGADGTGGSIYRGDLDEVALWSRVLTTEEMALVYQRGTAQTALTGSNFVDTDNDGLPDAWEMARFGNLSQSGETDSDHDGRTNAQEFALGTDPVSSEADPGVRFEVIPHPALPGQLTSAFHFKRPTGSSGIQYLPEWSTTLGDNDWASGSSVLLPLGTPVALPDGREEVTYYHPVPLDAGGRGFFRLRTSPVYSGSLTLSTLPEVDYSAGGPVVRWFTDQPTPTILEYGTGTSLSIRHEDYTLSTSHEVVLEEVGPGQSFSYSVVVLADGVESRSESLTAEGKWDLRPPRLPDQAGFTSPAAASASAGATLAAFGNSGKGFALDIGCGDGNFAYELVRNSELVVMAVESDDTKLAAARAFLAARGVLGSRVNVIKVASLTPAALPFRADTFNLITSSSAALSQPGAPASLAGFQGLLKPGRGRAVFGPAATVSSKPVPASHGRWVTLYGSNDNSSFSGEQLASAAVPAGASSTSQLEVQWIGRPGGAFTVDRGIRQPSPLAVNGRFYAIGDQRIVSLDSHNGAALWSKAMPGLARYNVIRDSSNLAADDDALFVAYRNQCWRIDGDTGVHTVYPVLPGPRSDFSYFWGLIFRQDALLIGSATKDDSAYTKWWGPQYWFDSQSGFDTNQVVSDNVFALNAATGATAWTYQNGLVLHPSLTISNGRVFFLESRDTAARAGSSRNLSMAALTASGPLWMVCLDLATGNKLWESQPALTGGTPSVYGLATSDRYIVASSNDPNDTFYLSAFNAATGAIVWSHSHAWTSNNHGGNHQHPVIVNGILYLEPKAYNATTGVLVAGLTMPSRKACSTFIGTKNALLYRGGQTTHYGMSAEMYGGNISLWDINSKTSSLWNRMRPSCWISTIAADGAVLIQDGSSGCSCGPWFETTISLTPL